MSPRRGRRFGPARIAALGVGALALAGVAMATCGPGGDGRPVRVVVPRGASLREAADSLAARGVVRSALLFRVYAKATGQDRAVKPGTYQLARGAPYATVVDALVNGRGVMLTITVVEGWELRQIAAQLTRVLDVPRDSVDAAARDTALLRRLAIPTSTVEGYLFPATYTFPAGTDARTAVRQMAARFEQAWDPAWDARLQGMAMSRHDAVTLASIVEREARKPEERPVIAAVYYNRLKKGMRLQADPTVQYARGAHTARVLYRDLEIDSPYNTYRRAGLPPGPIGSPGRPSLAAATAPAKVPYLYFVAHPDGHHEFRTTYAEHLVAVAEARRLLAAQAAARGSDSAGAGRSTGSGAPAASSGSAASRRR